MIPQFSKGCLATNTEPCASDMTGGYLASTSPPTPHRSNESPFVKDTHQHHAQRPPIVDRLETDIWIRQRNFATSKTTRKIWHLFFDWSCELVTRVIILFFLATVFWGATNQENSPRFTTVFKSGSLKTLTQRARFSGLSLLKLGHPVGWEADRRW